MKRQTKLNSTEQQQTQAAEQQTQQAALDFSSAEEVLRYDADHTPVPATVEQRLAESTRDLPPPTRPWWKRWLGISG